MTGAESTAGRLVALTGATGFLGSHIADLLLSRGCRVRASVRPTSDLRYLRNKPIQTVQVPLAPSDDEDDPALGRFLTGAIGLIHCAGVTQARDEAGYQHGNVETTRRLLNAAQSSETCKTFILISSVAAAGPAPPENPLTEAATCRPISPYGRSKLAAEVVLQKAGVHLRTAILRPPSLYGPRDRAFLPLFRVAQAGWMVHFKGGVQGFSLVDGRDAAAAAVTLLETAGATGPFFVDDGHIYRWPDIRDALGKAFGRKLRGLPIPTSVLAGSARVMGSSLSRLIPLLEPNRVEDLLAPGWVCSGEKLRRETGFRSDWTLENGFSDVLTYYRSRGWLT